MVRSRTPPPLSDRKRVLADAQRRRSLASLPTQHHHGEPSEDEEDEDAMDIDGSPTALQERGRRAKRGEVADRLASSSARGPAVAGPPSASKALFASTPTAKRSAAAEELPTWTPLRVQNPSDSGDISDSASSEKNDELLPQLRPTAKRHAQPPTVRYQSKAKASFLQSQVERRDSAKFKLPMDVLRWLPPGILPGSDVPEVNSNGATNSKVQKSGTTVGVINSTGGKASSNASRDSSRDATQSGPSITYQRTQALLRLNELGEDHAHSSHDEDAASAASKGKRKRADTPESPGALTPATQDQTDGSSNRARKSRANKRRAEGQDESWATSLVEVYNRAQEAAAFTMRRSGSGSRRSERSKSRSRKGKERERDVVHIEIADTDSDVDVEEGEPPRPEEILSPAVPHPSLPDDSFEDEIYVDEHVLGPPSSSSSVPVVPPSLSSGEDDFEDSSVRWRVNAKISKEMEDRVRYYIGRRPTATIALDKGKGRAVELISTGGAEPARRKRARSVHEQRAVNQQIDAMNAINALNSRLDSRASESPNKGERAIIKGHLDVFNAVGKNNIRVVQMFNGRDESSEESRDQEEGRRGGRVPAAQPRPRPPARPSARRRHTTGGAAAPGASPAGANSVFVPEGNEKAGFVLDLDTLKWRRRTAADDDDAAAGPVAGPSTGPSASGSRAAHSRSEAGPSSAVSANSPAKTGARGEVAASTGTTRKRSTGRPRGRPRLYPPGQSPRELAKGRPRGRPRLHPPGQGSEEIAKGRRPRGRPRKDGRPPISRKPPVVDLEATTEDDELAEDDEPPRTDAARDAPAPATPSLPSTPQAPAAAGPSLHRIPLLVSGTGATSESEASSRTLVQSRVRRQVPSASSEPATPIHEKGKGRAVPEQSGSDAVECVDLTMEDEDEVEAAVRETSPAPPPEPVREKSKNPVRGAEEGSDAELGKYIDLTRWETDREQMIQQSSAVPSPPPPPRANTLSGSALLAATSLERIVQETVNQIAPSIPRPASLPTPLPPVAAPAPRVLDTPPMALQSPYPPPDSSAVPPQPFTIHPAPHPRPPERPAAQSPPQNGPPQGDILILHPPHSAGPVASTRTPVPPAPKSPPPQAPFMSVFRLDEPAAPARLFAPAHPPAPALPPPFSPSPHEVALIQVVPRPESGDVPVLPGHPQLQPLPDLAELPDEYQSRSDLVDALVASMPADVAREAPAFAGCYAVIVDSKNRLAEAFVRKVAKEIRDEVRERLPRFVFRPQPFLVQPQNIGEAGQRVTASYGCQCPYRAPAGGTGRGCQGIVSVAAEEVVRKTVYKGIKGVRITFRIQHPAE